MAHDDDTATATNTTTPPSTTEDFWAALETTLSTPCHDFTQQNIDDVLRSYLALLEAHYGDFITTEDHLGHCAYVLYVSPLFEIHAEYIRQQLVYCLLQEEEINILRIAVTFLLADARENETTFEMLNREGTFPRLVELIANPKDGEEGMHRSLMELLYEMARIQKITNDDLTCVDDAFVRGLFEIIEEVSDDVNDPYHYPVIRVLLVLNEQYMVAAHDPAVLSQKAMPLTNKVVKVLSSNGHEYKTFGANIILLLNREDEKSLQLLTLKLMYLLFTTPPTYEYFYTNDLRVLVDILVRNLLDLPESEASLRHTYLRVLYPLLEHTQLQYPPYYKRLEICKLLSLFSGDAPALEDGSPPMSAGWSHFEDVDETTKRLVKRCQTVSWLIDPEASNMVRVESPVEDRSPEAYSPTSPSKPKPPQLPAPRKLRKRDSSKSSTLTIGQFLTPQLESARQSSISMAEIAQQKEKPGVITPSRNPSMKQGIKPSMFSKREKPPPPQARRSTFRRPKAHAASTELEITRLGVPEKTHTPVEARNEAEKYEDAVEEQTIESDKMLDDISDEKTQAIAEGAPTKQPDEPPVQSKKPPPAPKARRGWRMRKSKDFTSEESRSTEPGKFSTKLPSVQTELQSPFSPPAEDIPESSPFSPTEVKTLDPMLSPTSPSNGAEPKRSVSDALNSAQAQATQQVEECLEAAHISDDFTPSHPLSHTPTLPIPQSRPKPHPPRTSSLQHSISATQLENTTEISTQPSLKQAVLAPPGLAPIRAVPGPKVDVDKSQISPFLSDDEKAKEKDHEKEKTLKTKDSWEDFGDDD